MPEASSHAPFAETVGTDLPCPACGYNLRGLAGDVAACPECGRRWDLLALFISRQRYGWWDAPGLSRLELPAWWTLFLFGPVMVGTCFGAVPASIVAAAWLAVWVPLARGAWRIFRGWQGVANLLLAHLVVLAIVAGAVGIAGGVIVFAISAIEGAGGMALIATAGWLGGLLAVVVGHHGQVYLGRICLRAYLKQSSGLAHDSHGEPHVQ
ncbi:MAG: hypothetical protein WDZ31_01870 [Phycisphaeraceae bacterium]